MHSRSLALVVTLVVAAAAVRAQSVTPSPSYGPELEGFDYPQPLHHFPFTSQGEALQMAYMDVAPAGQANGRTVVLMHGKMGIARVTLVAHSSGGMIATRYALMSPQSVEQLVLVDPLGLEDRQAKGVPARTVDEWTQRERLQTADKIRDYERQTYYVGQWKPEYERWVDMLAGLQQGPGRELVGRNSALVYDMIQTQPVVYEFPLLKVPTVLMIGTRDTTAIGSDVAPPEVKARIGHYDVLGPAVARSIPGMRLVTFEGLGHAPQIQAPEEFDRRLVDALATAAR